MSSKSKYSECLNYINNYWNKIIYYNPKDENLLIGLPNEFVAPSNDEFSNKMYYWDSYFIILGLIEEGKIDLAEGIVKNFFYLLDRFKFIPQSNRFYHLGKSNPPFLSSMVKEIYNCTGDKKWIRKGIKYVEMEYYNVWMSKDRLTSTGLSRYFEPSRTNEQAEDESGWDRTSRFKNRCLDILPVDLNCLLFQYEMDLSYFYNILKNLKLSNYWKKRAQKRKKLIMKYFWNEKKGYFFDYDFIKKKKLNVWSLAGFYPLWSKIVSKTKALRIINNLRHFEYKYGLVATRRDYLKGYNKRQWDYPIGWANLHWIVLKGLSLYNFQEDLIRISQKWLTNCNKTYLKTNYLWENYNVVRGGTGRIGRYSTQKGFGWTNAIFLKILELLSCKKNNYIK